MKVIEIVKANLVANGFDGLVHPDAECGCLRGDLVPCCGDFGECQPGYRGADEQGNADDWAIYTSKERALESLDLVRSRSNSGEQA